MACGASFLTMALMATTMTGAMIIAPSAIMKTTMALTDSKIDVDDNYVGDGDINANTNIDTDVYSSNIKDRC